MHVDRSTALNGLALLAGLLLVSVTLLSPPEAPTDRVEFYVEPAGGGEPAWETLRYGDLSADARDAFDTARTDSNGYYNATLGDSPDGITPPPDGISVWNVEYEDELYLLQAKHYAYEVDLVGDVLPRVVVAAVGLLLAITGAYREFT